MANPKSKHFSKILCIFFHCIIYFYLHAQMSSMCLQMRRLGCWGFQENRLLQQSGHYQHTVETAKQTQIFLVFHTHWDLTDKTGDRTEILLPSSEVSKNFGVILVQWAHAERTLKALLHVEVSQKPSTLTFPKSDQPWKAKAFWNLYKNLMSKKQLASQTKHCNPPK